MADTKYTILAINPGSTSTRIAVYENQTLLFQKKVDHPAASLRVFSSNVAQFPIRLEAIKAALAAEQFDLRRLAAVAGRGGKLPPLEQGAYLVNDDMLTFLRDHPIDDHASNLGALLAQEIAQPLGIPAYIYDAVVMDQMEDIAKLSRNPPQGFLPCPEYAGYGYQGRTGQGLASGGEEHHRLSYGRGHQRHGHPRRPDGGRDHGRRGPLFS